MRLCVRGTARTVGLACSETRRAVGCGVCEGDRRGNLSRFVSSILTLQDHRHITLCREWVLMGGAGNNDAYIMTLQPVSGLPPKQGILRAR